HASLSYTLPAEVERLELSGWSVNDTGNTLDNTLIGSQGNNLLDGGAGADQMQGGQGSDTYIVDNVGDQITENANAGTDTVQSSVSYTLAANVENLILTGVAQQGTGNELANTITGNAENNTLLGGWGNDRLLGGDGDDTLIGDDGSDTLIGDDGDDTLIGDDGSDTLTGGAGADQFGFTGVPGHGADVITDYQAGVDKLVFDATIFTALGVGPVNAGMFRSGQWSVAAQDADDHLLFQKSAGALYYDPDGNGVMAKFLVATLQGVHDLDAADIQVITPPGV
ncbi:MAG: furin, partial [Betaproteobacteria bacterium]|nr:furin [Betaproteobacteria bacterium]